MKNLYKVMCLITVCGAMSSAFAMDELNQSMPHVNASTVEHLNPTVSKAQISQVQQVRGKQKENKTNKRMNNQKSVAEILQEQLEAELKSAHLLAEKCEQQAKAIEKIKTEEKKATTEGLQRETQILANRLPTLDGQETNAAFKQYDAKQSYTCRREVLYFLDKTQQEMMTQLHERAVTQNQSQLLEELKLQSENMRKQNDAWQEQEGYRRREENAIKVLEEERATLVNKINEKKAEQAKYLANDE